MKKETTFAIILGVLFGVIVASFIIFKARETQLEKTKIMSATLKITPTISNRIDNFQPLFISEPESGYITDSKSVIIKGKSDKNALIVMQSPVKNLAYKNTKGDFSIEFPLALGENVVNVTAYSKESSNVQERQLLIYYLTD